MSSYIRDGKDIYARSFSIIRSEANLSTFTAEQEAVCVRMIHAAGQTDLADDIEFSPACVVAARKALRKGSPILTDVTMVASGITRSRLPANNMVRCMLHDPATVARANQVGTTRSAAAIELWEPFLDNSVVAIGNAPTALFHLIDWLAADDQRPRPAVIVGIPVGFVGATESKIYLAKKAAALGTEFLTVHGRRGGSAITCAAINALAQPKEIL